MASLRDVSESSRRRRRFLGLPGAFTRTQRPKTIFITDSSIAATDYAASPTAMTSTSVTPDAAVVIQRPSMPISSLASRSADAARLPAA